MSPPEIPEHARRQGKHKKVLTRLRAFHRGKPRSFLERSCASLTNSHSKTVEKPSRRARTRTKPEEPTPRLLSKGLRIPSNIIHSKCLYVRCDRFDVHCGRRF